MCGGSTNQRFLPPIVNGLRAQPSASTEPFTAEITRCRGVAADVGASSAMPWAVPPLTTTMWPSAGIVRCQ